MKQADEQDLGSAEQAAPAEAARQASNAHGWAWPVIGAAVVGGLWTRQVARHVTFEDSGALAAAAVDFGVPHPPGYPLWTLVSGASWRLAEIAGGIGPAHWFSLLSAVFAAVTVLFLSRLARASGAGPGTTLLIALALWTSATFSSQAVITEVYALAAACQSALAFYALAPIARPRAAWFALGLALAAHPGSLFFAPLALVASARARPEVVRFGASHVLLFVLPLSSFGLLPLMAARDPLVRWGELANLEQWRDHVLRAQYIGELGGSAGPRLQFVIDTAGPLLPLAAGAAISALLLGRSQSGSRWAALLLLATTAFGTYAVIGYDLEAEVTRLRLTGAVVPLVIASTATLAVSLARLAVTLGGCALVPANLLIAALLWLAPQTGPHLEHRDFTARTAGSVWSELALTECPEGALLIVNRLGYTDALAFPLWYAQATRDLRPDVIVISRALLDASWYREQLARRHPELAPGLALIDVGYATVGGEELGPRERRLLNGVFLAWAFDGPRPLVFSDPPGPKVLGERSLLPGGVLWHADPATQPERLTCEATEARWISSLESEPAGPWRAEFERLAAVRTKARVR